jgi:UDP-glucose 4-epimerase
MMEKNTTILVTGGAGYIGSHILLALCDAGINAVALDDLSTGHRLAIPDGVPFIEGNIGDANLLDQVFNDYKIAVILHLAGSVIAPESIREPLAYYQNNTFNSIILLDAAHRHNVGHFIFSSTAAVYGNPGITPIAEDVIPQPISPYGMSKLFTEQIIADTAKAYPFSHVILRYFNAAGADPEGRAGPTQSDPTHLIEIACKTALGHQPYIPIFGGDYPTPDGTCIRDYVHVTDIAAAHINAIQYLLDGGESLTLNCGYGRGYSVKDVLLELSSLIGKEVPWEMMPRRLGDAPSIVAKTNRIRTLLGWQPQHDDLKAILGTALGWERQR